MIETLHSALVTLHLACGTTQVIVVKEASRYDRNNVSHQAEMIESTNPEEWMVRATGGGNHRDGARRRKACGRLLLLVAEPESQTADDQNAVMAYEHEVFENAPLFITYESGIKGKRAEGGKTYLTKNYRVRVDLIREAESRNVIASQEEINDKLDLPIVMITNQPTATRHSQQP